MDGVSRLGAVAALVVLLGSIGAPWGHALEAPMQAGAPTFHSDRILVRFDPGAAASERAAARASVGASLDVRYTIVPGLERLKIGRGRSVETTGRGLSCKHVTRGTYCRVLQPMISSRPLKAQALQLPCRSTRYTGRGWDRSTGFASNMVPG